MLVNFAVPKAPKWRGFFSSLERASKHRRQIAADTALIRPLDGCRVPRSIIMHV